MAKTKQQNIQALKTKRLKKEASHLHFAMTTKNYMIIGAGIVLIILGYILMSENSVDGFLPTIVAPILLIFGYCVVVPIGILYKGNEVSGVEPTATVKETKQEVKSNVSTVSSNVKAG